MTGSEALHEEFFQSDYHGAHGGIVGDGLYWVTGSLLGDAGSSVAVIFLLLASAFLITGASVRLVLMATGSGARRAAVSAGRTTRQLGHTLTERRSVESASTPGGTAIVAARNGDEAGVLVPFGIDPDLVAQRPALGESLVTFNGGEGTPLDGAETYPDIFHGKPSLALVEPGDEIAAEATKPGTFVDPFKGIGVEAGKDPDDGPAPVQEELFPVSE